MCDSLSPVYQSWLKQLEILSWISSSKTLIIQILAMITEQERTESKRRQAQGIKIAKANEVYKGRPKLYSANTKDPQRRLVY
jgi:DNA invertase Pin-like site-specific DNA recombinase